MTTASVTSESSNWKRPFFTIWTGQAISLLGSQLVQFAIIWYLTIEYDSATVLAVASMIGMLPQVFLGPFIGALVDRWDRRKIMLVADTCIALITAGLAILFWFGLIQVWQIYLVLFLRSIGAGFHGPAMSASTSLMVPRQYLTRIQGVNQTLNGGLNIISAPLGALLIELLPTEGILAIDVISALFAIAPLLFIAIPQPVRSAQALAQKPSMRREMKEGLVYIWNWKGLLIIAALATLINFMLAPAFSLMPLLVRSHFEGGALELGWVNAAFGVGVIVGGLLLGIWGGFKRRILTSILGVSGIGLGAFLLGLVPGTAFYAAVLLNLFVGIAMPIANGSLGGITQAIVEPAMQGRVFTLIGSAATAMTPLGLAIAGPVSDWLGIQTWFIIGGVTCMGMALVMLATPAVMNVEQGRDGEPGSPESENPET